jgi:hypothetical protein
MLRFGTTQTISNIIRSCERRRTGYASYGPASRVKRGDILILVLHPSILAGLSNLGETQ